MSMTDDWVLYLWVLIVIPLAGAGAIALAIWYVWPSRVRAATLASLDTGNKPWEGRRDWAAGLIAATQDGDGITRLVRGWLGKRIPVAEFRMASVPGVIGGELSGAVLLPAPAASRERYVVNLACQNSETVSGHDDSFPVEPVGKGLARLSGSRFHCFNTLLWVAQHDATGVEHPNEPDRTAIPVAFRIPADCAETGKLDNTHFIKWILLILSAVEKDKVIAEFDVPVFYADASPAQPVVADANRQAIGISDQASSEVVNPRLRAIEQTKGVEYVTLADASVENVPVALGMLVTVLAPVALSIALYLLFDRVWLLCFMPVGLVLLPIYNLTRPEFQKLKVSTVGDGLLVKEGVWRKQHIPLADVVKVECETDFMAGSTPWHRVAVHTRLGRSVIVAKRIRARAEAENLVQKLRASLVEMKRYSK